MIPRAHVTAWRRDAPWPTDAQVEQDLGPLLAPGVDWDLTEAARLVISELVPRLQGEPWKGPGKSSDDDG